MSQSSALFAAFLVLALTGHVQAAEVDVPQGLSGNWRVQEVSGAEAAATPPTPKINIATINVQKYSSLP